MGNVGRKALGEGMGIEGCGKGKGKGKGNGDWEHWKKSMCLKVY